MIDRPTANRSELPAEDRSEEAKQVEIARAVDQPRADDDRGNAVSRHVADRQLGFRLRRLVGVGGAKRRVLVGRSITG